MRSLLASLIIALLLVPPGVAQNAQQPPINPRSAPASPPAPAKKPTTPAAGKGTIRRAVDLVLIDVSVTNRSGKPVTGLTPEQFIVLEDDKQQKVSSFEYYDIEAIETAVVPNAQPIVVPLGTIAPSEKVRQAVRDHRLIVLFFDMTAMQPEELLRARESAERYIREQISPADLVAVVVFGNRLNIPSHFTNNREVLLRAVQSLRPGKESQLAGLAEAAPQPGEDTTLEDTGSAFTPDETEFNIFNTDRKLAAIESLSELLRGIPGKKSVIHFTGGITQTGEENRSQLRASTDAANRANVSLYTVDARGLMPIVPGGEARLGTPAGTSMFTGAGKATAKSASSRAMFSGTAVFQQIAGKHNSRETLATLAMDTGGRYFFDLNDFGEVFKKVQADSPGYYLLGYYSTNPKQDGRWRHVKVKVNMTVPGGVHVRYREGYYAPKDYGIAGPEDRERQLIEAMRAEAPRVELPVALETAQFRLNANEFFIPIAAKLSPSALEWASKHGRREAEFDFAAEVRDEKTGRAVGALRDTIKVTLGNERFQQLQQRALVYQGGMVLGPGKYRLKFLARESETGRIGSFEQELVLSPPEKEQIELSTVLLSNQLESVRENSEVKRKALGREANLKTTPLEVSGERMVPSVTHLFTNQQQLYVLFQAYLPANTDSSKVHAGLVFFRNGQWASETPMVEPAEAGSKSQTASFRIGLPLEKLAPGSYTVQAIVVEGEGEQVAFARNYFAVRFPPTAAVPAPSAAVPAPSGARPQ